MRRLIVFLLSLALIGGGWPASAALAENRGVASGARLAPASLRAVSLTIPAVFKQGGILVPATQAPSVVVSAVGSAATAAPAAKAAAPLAQAQAFEHALAITGSGEQPPCEQSRELSETLWSGARAPAASPQASATPGGAFSRGVARLTRARRAGITALMTAAAVPAAPALAAAALPDRASAALHQAAPFLVTGAGLVATHYLAQFVRWGVERWGERAGKDENTTAVVRLLATIATWVVGASLTLTAANVSMETILASVGGVGGTAALFLSQEITNLLEGVKVLLARPFRIGDNIRKGGKDYVVRRLEMTYLSLAVYQGSSETPEYRQLAATPLTVLRPYIAPALVKPSVANATLWLLLASALLVGVPYLQGWVAWKAVLALLPWVKTGAILFAARRAELWAAAMIEKFAEWRRWTSHRTAVLTFAARALIYVAGLGFVLSGFGLTWVAALTSVGVSSLIAGWVVREALTSLYFGLKILWTQPFHLGDVIEISGVTGRVVEMNLQYVVLEHKENTHTLIPYAVFKDAAVVRLSKDDADTSMPKLTPVTSLPPSQRAAIPAPL